MGCIAAVTVLPDRERSSELLLTLKNSRRKRPFLTAKLATADGDLSPLTTFWRDGGCQTREVSITCYFSGNGPTSKTILFLATISGNRSSACTMKFDSLSTSSALIMTLKPLSMSILSKILSGSVHPGPRVAGTFSTSRMNSEKKGEVIVARVWDNA